MERSRRCGLRSHFPRSRGFRPLWRDTPDRRSPAGDSGIAEPRRSWKWPGARMVPGGPGVGGGVTAPALVSAIAMRRGQPAGPTSDQEIEDFIYDALELLPGSSEVEVRCDGGRTSLSGAVWQKRLERDIGEIAWAIPAINDVQNNITIAPRRRSRHRTVTPRQRPCQHASQPSRSPLCIVGLSWIHALRGT